jgi:hypothetical protein
VIRFPGKSELPIKVKLTVVLGIGQPVKIVVVKPDRVIVAEHLPVFTIPRRAISHGVFAPYSGTAINSFRYKTPVWMVGVLRLAMDHDCEERLGHELLTNVEQHQSLPYRNVI